MTSDAHYVHGTDPEEQERLSRLNALLNASSLGAMALKEGEKILDVGSGLGILSRMMARKTGSRGKVVGIERDGDQLHGARRLARNSGEDGLVEFRQGKAACLPLADHEWGSFDVAHTRFLLEHVSDPLAVVREMLRAVRRGGRIILEDDDHDLLRLWPEPAGVMEIWRAYYLTYEKQGKDPFVGRRLVGLLHQAGAQPRRNMTLPFGSCAGSPNFDAMVENFIGIIDGARGEMIEFDLAAAAEIDRALDAFRAWKERPDAAMWYSTAWAEGERLLRSADADVESGSTQGTPRPARAASVSPARPRDETISATRDASLLRFLMAAAAELSSSLELDAVFHKIATGIRPLIDYHLFCIMLWSESEQILEHSFSMCYGEAIPQKGGFPLGYGISGTAAKLRRPVRTANVLEHPNYVRCRHPEVEIRSELAVPLVFQDQLIGVIDLESTRLDYFTEEHEHVVSALASHIAVALVNARLHEKVLRDERRLERDLATAREIQHGLLPRSSPHMEHLQIGSSYVPARQLGGDFFDFLRYGRSRLAVAVGDVAGKATPAALVASMTVGLLRGHVMEHQAEPAEMLTEMNEVLQGVGEDHQFVAMVYAVYDETKSEVCLASAGFPRPLLAQDGSVSEVPIRGLPLGLFTEASYQVQRFPVSAGDVLVFCSDGLLECADGQGRDFASQRLESVLTAAASRGAQEIADELTSRASEFTGSSKVQMDDYTVVVLKFR